MSIIQNLSACCGCGACQQACPKQCIMMIRNEEGFLYPKVDTANCVACGKCERVCPACDLEKRVSMDEAYAAIYRDEQIRFQSSSGGIFSPIAKLIEDNSGSVFGAFFSEDCKSVLHGKNSIQRLRTSKYVQSVIGNAYKEAEKELKEGKLVLFTGTPCQIAGLKKYLNVDYDNLLCIDIICHGVPSPEIWKKYLDDLENKNHAKIKYVNFRHKQAGWKNFKVSLGNDSFEVYETLAENPYMNLFLKNYSLRPSCYTCSVKKSGSLADLTLGDFWGIEKIAPEMNDGRGTSLVVVHTSKGKDWFMKIQSQLIVKKVEYAATIQFNTPLFQSVSAPADRKDFFEDFQTMEIEELAKKYCFTKKTIRQMVSESKVGQIIKRIIRGGGVNNKYVIHFSFEKLDS